MVYCAGKLIESVVCCLTKHPPPHHLQQVLKWSWIPKKIASTGTIYKNVGLAFVPDSCHVLYYHLIQDCVILSCGLLNKLKAFSVSKTNISLKLLSMASLRSVQNCTHILQISKQRLLSFLWSSRSCDSNLRGMDIGGRKDDAPGPAERIFKWGG